VDSSHRVLIGAGVGFALGGIAGYIYGRQSASHVHSPTSLSSYNQDVAARTVAGGILGLLLGVLVAIGKTWHR
jgi:hypothetical protein